MAATENLPIRQVAGTITTDETGKAVSVRPVRFVDGDVAADEAGRPVPTIPYSEVAGLTTTNSAGQRVSVMPVRVVAGASAVDETGRPVSVLALKQQGLPPYAFPANAMDIGMGLAENVAYLGSYPFANVMWSAGTFAQRSGSGSFTQGYDGLVASDETDTFFAEFIENSFDTVPTGTYTVLNPNGCEIGIGNFGSPHLVGYTTSAQFTFSYSGTGLVGLWVRGSCSGVKVILPGHLASYQSGDIFNADWLAFQASLNYKTIRFMDPLASYKDISENWSERAPMTAQTLRDPSTKLATKWPYEACIAACNRLNKHFWLNVPVRATDDYCTQLATLIRDTLNSNLYVKIEPVGNEVWNFGGSYYDQTSWVWHLQNTRYEAVPNFGINGYTHVGHGMTNGQQICDFATKENFVSTAKQIYPNGYGSINYAEVVDADNFRIRQGSVSGTIQQPDAGMTKLIYKRHTGAGGEDISTNYGKRAVQVWSLFDAVLGRNRCVHIMATQLANTSHTTTRLAQTGALAATDAVATAFYYTGDWGLALGDIASGQVTFKAWAQDSGCSYICAVYANGSTPTANEVKTGTGTGYIGHRSIPITAYSQYSYYTASAITGLTNGTTYRWERIFTDRNGDEFRESGTFVASATPSTFTMPCTNEKQAMRSRKSTLFWMTYALAQQAVTGGKPLVNYEVNSDFFANNAVRVDQLVEVFNWRRDWHRSAEGAATLAHHYRALAANNYKESEHFVDLNGLQPGVFDLVRHIGDTTDARRAAFAGFNGQVAKVAPLAVSDIAATNILTEPSYPYVVHTFANASLTYQIYSGNLDGNFAIVGNELRMVSGVGINWAPPQGRTIRIEASDGNTTAYPTISFATGDAWYEADALFAWSAVEDTDAVAIDPVKGGQLPQTQGATPAVWASNAFTFDGTKGYGSATGMTAGIPVNTPFLLAVCIDKNSNTSAGKVHAVFGISHIIQLDQDYSGATRLKFTGYNGSSGVADIYTTTAATPSGKHVHWFYYDADPTTPRYYAGMDQVENTAGAVTRTLTANMPRNLYIGRDQSGTILSLAKLAAAQAVSRSGLTKADVLAIVAKMQAHHGIT